MIEGLSREDIIADEAFMVAQGGEMPEVAFYSALYYLTDDEEGPAFELSAHDIGRLQEAVVRRYQTIILRDLCSANRNTSIYRGVERSAANWQRLQLYARRQNIDISAFQAEAGRALLLFLKEECEAVIGRGEESVINCSAQRLLAYAERLGVHLDTEVAQWRRLF
ncbi:MAG: hypothetical protein C0613_02485 [Desulfobulbaceae bacterium]|nr:MAG: hypothetical protein C0613_02485 [Desulfobulbaceae bacterium]